MADLWGNVPVANSESSSPYRGGGGGGGGQPIPNNKSSSPQPDPNVASSPPPHGTVVNIPDILREKYTIEGVIGQGGFGVTFLVNSPQAPHMKYVAKVMNTANMSAKDQEHVKSEVVCLNQCNHMNIIKFCEAHTLDTQLILVVEYADGGDLSYQIKQRAKTRNRFSEEDITTIFVQVLLGAHYIHGLDILHRDIKPANIFLTRMGVIKLGDFGLSRMYEETISGPVGGTVCGTPSYISPEMWRGQKYSKASDLWALGIVLYELMTLRKPFLGKDITEVRNAVLAGTYPAIPTGIYSAELTQLCQSLLHSDPTQRPAIPLILQSQCCQTALRTIAGNVGHVAYGGDVSTKSSYLEELKKYLV
eukprot:PhF_6_TR37845/c4_g1_i1/m.56344/K08857/NEK1_4_5; NIMA (never in mitosis gene a)-related kinase 1/4/5